MLVKKKRIRIGFLTKEECDEKNKNPFFDNFYAGGSLEILQDDASFVKSKKAKREYTCPFPICDKKFQFYYTYGMYVWSPYLDHAINFHYYVPPVDFCRFINQMIEKYEWEIRERAIKDLDQLLDVRERQSTTKGKAKGRGKAK